MSITVHVSKTMGSVAADAYLVWTITSDDAPTAVDATVSIDGAGPNPCWDIDGPISPYVGSVVVTGTTRTYRVGNPAGWVGDAVELAVTAEATGGGGGGTVFEQEYLEEVTGTSLNASDEPEAPWFADVVIKKVNLGSTPAGSYRLTLTGEAKNSSSGGANAWALAASVTSAEDNPATNVKPLNTYTRMTMLADEGNGGAYVATTFKETTGSIPPTTLNSFVEFTAPGGVLWLHVLVLYDVLAFDIRTAWLRNYTVLVESLSGGTESDTDEATWAIADGHTTAVHVMGPGPFTPFYYLKITGLPYYFGSIIDPTDLKWGEAQWTLPEGMTWIKGMEVPSSSFDQQLKDIIGGIASAERVRLQVTDFDTSGGYKFFGRMLAPGRTAASATATVGSLAADITAAATSGSILVRGGGGDFTDIDTYIGGETIGISAVSGPDGDGIYTLTIDERNKFPCHENYPPRPMYRIVKDDAGVVDWNQSVLVSQYDPISFINRTAALYIGHLKPDGTPEPESTSLCRIIGSIRGINYGREDGQYELEIESVMADLEKALVAPNLAHATVAKTIVLPTTEWTTFWVQITGWPTTGGGPDPSIASSRSYSIPPGTYSNIETVIGTLNDTLRGDAIEITPTFKFFFSAESEPVDDSYAIKIVARANHDSFTTFTWKLEVAYPLTPVPGVGLLSALGFQPTDNLASVPVNVAGKPVLTVAAARAIPFVFIPTRRIGSAMTIPLVAGTNGIGTDIGSRFFVDQGDGSGIAYVRMGNGQVLPVTAKTTSSLTLSDRAVAGSMGANIPFSYGASSEEATVDQVIHIPSGNTTTGEECLFQLLASKGYANDGFYNVFPEGVGFGLVDIMNDNTFAENQSIFQATYSFDVDRTTKFGELWTGIAKLFGLFLVWDVETCAIALRSLRPASSALSGADSLVLSESNRPEPSDRTKVDVDIGNLRTGWVVKYGYDYKEKKFKAGDFTITDNYAIAAYKIASRTETIEDRLVPDFDTAGARTRYTTAILERLAFTRYPQAKIQRTVNLRGLLLSPGTFHKIVDRTIVNPFTGRLGITSDDDVYCFITGVKMNYEKGEVQVTAIVDQVNDSSVMRPWSPCGLVDYSAGVNGYVTATGVVTMASNYQPDGAYDGMGFRVGDKVTIISRSNDGALSYEQNTEIFAISSNGQEVTVDDGLPAFPDSDVEAIMILQDWAAQTTARRSTPATRVAFQADGAAQLIDGDARPHKWS